MLGVRGSAAASSSAIRSSRSSTRLELAIAASLLRPWRQFSARGCATSSSRLRTTVTSVAEALERAGAGLDRLDAARGAELGERDARELSRARR